MAGEEGESGSLRLRPPAGYVVAALFVALMLVLPVPPAVAQDAEPSTIPELEQAFQIQDVRSDFVVVIDTSGSMGQGPDPLYPKVQAAFGSLVDALPSGDRLSVVTFDSVPTISFDGPIDDSNRAQAKQLPSRLGNATDIGAALNTAVERLDRPDAAQIQTVIFITDGRHEPPSGSAFAQVGSPAWVAAQARASGLEGRRTILVRALGLTDAGKQGAELAGQVFSTPEVAQLSGQQLVDYLTSEVGKARMRVLAAAIQSEIDNNVVDVQLESSGELSDEVKVSATLTSGLPHLGVDVDLERVRATDFEGEPIRSSIVGGSRTIHLAPGGSASFEILVKPSIGDGGFPDWPPPKREEVDVQLDFEQSAHATPTELLETELGVSTSVTVNNADPFTVGRTVGMTWSQLILWTLIVLIVLVVVLYTYWRWIRRPRLVGELVLDGAAADSFPAVRLRGKSMRVDGAEFGRPGRTTVRFFTRRGKRGQVFAERVGIEGAFDRKSGSNKWSPFEAGSEVGFGLYRLDDEGGVRFRWRYGEEHE